MSSCGLTAAALALACVLTFTSAQSSCKQRCGMGYYRGYTCQCDYSCLVYGECCRDYESLCTTKNSCKGRCGETFKRGRPCSCDAECVKYNQCCPDHKEHCDEPDPTPEATAPPVDNPDGDFIPNLNPTSYPQDDPNSASKQIFHNGDLNGPDSIPLPELSSGSPPTDLLEDLTTGPPLPDLDGFEILPEPVTISSETTTAASEGETTPDPTAVVPSTAETTADPTTVVPSTAETTADPTTVVPSTAETTAGTTVADEATTAPEPTTAVDAMSTQPTSNPTTIFTELQTEEALTVTSEPPSTSLEVTTLAPEITNTTEMTEEMTTLKYEQSPTPENIAPSTIAPSIIAPSTIVPTTTNEETTTTPEINTTESLNPTTVAQADADSEISTMATADAGVETTTAEGRDVTQGPTQSNAEATTKPAEKPSPEKPFRPVLSPEHKPVLNGLDVNTQYQADDSNDTDLCSGRPITGLTTLSNGTVVVFRGHFFWVLDPNRVPGPARGITQTWGIPSPIDTVFTRCNCQGKTYIFKGPQYWRYENDVLDPGFPRVIQTGFDGLRGHVTAALSVPQYNRRRESVYFFKRGGTVQKYSYQFGTNPSCGRKLNYAVYTHGNRNRLARQAPAHVSVLEPVINYRTSWRGFPTTITAAVSIPNKREPEGYSYYVFSRSKSFRIRMDEDRPVVAAPKLNTAAQSHEVFKCPKKASPSH